MLSPKTTAKNGSWVCGRLMPSLSCDHENVCAARKLSPPTRKFAIFDEGKNREICNFPKQQRFLWNCHWSNSGITRLRQYAIKRVKNHFYKGSQLNGKLTLFNYFGLSGSSNWHYFCMNRRARHQNEINFRQSNSQQNTYQVWLSNNNSWKKVIFFFHWFLKAINYRFRGGYAITKSIVCKTWKKNVFQSIIVLLLLQEFRLFTGRSENAFECEEEKKLSFVQRQWS